MKYQEYTSNGGARGRSPAQIESDLATIRSEMSYTLQTLEEKFSPRALIDVLIARFRGTGEGPSAFASNLGSTVRDNPVPVLLVAAGLATLLGKGRSHGGHVARSESGDTGDGDFETETAATTERGEALAYRAREAREGLAARRESMANKARELAGGARERAQRLREREHELGVRARERSAALGERMRGAAQRTRAQGSRAIERGSNAIDQEPLVIVGLGLALGAMLGAGTPVSERERGLLGGAGERVARRARKTANIATESMAEATERITDAMQAQPAAPHEQPYDPYEPLEAGDPDLGSGGGSR